MKRLFISIFVLKIIFLAGFSQNFFSNTVDEINRFLKDFKGEISFQVLEYDKTGMKRKNVFSPRTNAKKGEETILFLDIDEGKWHCETKLKQLDVHGMYEMQVKFRLDKGQMEQSAVAVKIDFNSWSRENYVMIPAIVYNGNRFRALEGGYCPDYPQDSYYNKNSPLMFSDNPRLSINDEPSKIELLTGNAATPAMTFYSPDKKKGFVLLTEQRTRFGNLGYFVEESADKKRASFIVSTPAVRQYRALFGGFEPSGDRATDWKEGDAIAMKFILATFEAKDIPDFLIKFQDYRKALTGETHPRNITPMSAIYDFSSKITDKLRWRESPYGNVYHNDFSDDFQLCWVSGMISSYPMLYLNDTLHIRRALSTLDFVVKNMPSKSGYFYGFFDMASGKVKTEYKRERIGMVTMTRKNADALYWFIKHFLLLKALGHKDFIKPEWEEAVKRLAEAFVKTWKNNGEWGQYLNPENGDIVIYNSTAAAMAPAALTLASKYFHEPEFLKTAQDAAKYYYERDVVKLGLTGGHSGDISQDADADSAYGLLESLLSLYWATGEKEWLEKAKVLAALAATWTLSYDYTFPEGSDLDKLGAHVAGAIWASVQNKHAAPGNCTSSADCLFKLYRETGDDRYAVMLKEIQHAHTEVVETPGRPTVSTGRVDWGNYVHEYGASSERIQPTDAEGKDRVGQLPSTSYGWTETNGMLMAMEIPGIYLQTDVNKLFVFDHVEATSSRKKDNSIVLTIKNPTRFAAEVSVFAETSAQAKKYLGYMDFIEWEKIKVGAGKTSEIHLSDKGEVINIKEKR